VKAQRSRRGFIKERANNQKIKALALITDGFGAGGGIAKYNRDLLKALCSLPACKEVVALPRLMTDDPEQLPPKLTYLTACLGGKVKYAVMALCAAFSKGPFDLIICGHIHLIPLAILLKRLLRCPVVLVIYGIDAWQPTKRIFVDSLIKQCDGFITISEFSKKKFQQWAGLENASWYLLPPCIELSSYGAGPKHAMLIDRYQLQKRSVLFTLARLSSFDRYKGIDEVLEVMPALLSKIPGLVYLIGGDGCDRGRLENKVKLLGLEEKVIFTGYIPEAEKADHYRLSDAFVMPGRGEGFGIVYLEALACGIPVVGSVLDASAEVIEHFEAGFAVDPRNLEDLKQGILKALACRDRKVSEKLALFSYTNFEKQVRQITNHFLRR
jgi:glycosyltransferase involved in cell wall biosynthesis